MRDQFLTAEIEGFPALKKRFREEWFRTISGNENKKKKAVHRSLLGGSAMQGSGFAYPGISRIYIEDTKDEQQ